VNTKSIIVGNLYDKYATNNPIARYLMKGFLDSVSYIYNQAKPKTVLEVGCGEGSLSSYLLNNSPKPDLMEICDLSLDLVPDNLDPFIRKREASIYELPYADKSFDMVVCCEVLEHLDEPDKGIAEIVRVSKKNIILSTPREPLWRILNVARAKYLRELGNTPGHIQHFNQKKLIKLAENYMNVRIVITPIPWIVLSGEPLK